MQRDEMIDGHRLPEWFIAEQQRIHEEAFEERERERARRGEPTSREIIARRLAAARGGAAVSDGLLVWHFAPDDGLTAKYGRKKRHPVTVGAVMRVRGEVVPCENGLHGSVRALDALGYAFGALVSRCVLRGTVVAHGDKHAASVREHLAVADAARTLHEFALWCAEGVLTREREAGREPDARSWVALAVKRQWLDGQATDAELDAAQAAWAASAAASAAARAAARDAAWAAAWDAAWTAQNAELERRLFILLRETCGYVEEQR